MKTLDAFAAIHAAIVEHHRPHNLPNDQRIASGRATVAIMPEGPLQPLASRHGWQAVNDRAEYRPRADGWWGMVSRVAVGGRYRWHASVVDGQAAIRSFLAWSPTEAAEYVEQHVGPAQ